MYIYFIQTEQKKLENIILNEYEIEGFDNIDSADQARVGLLLKNSKDHVERIMNATKKNIPTDNKQNATIQHKARNDLVSAKESAIKIMYTNADQLTTLKHGELKNQVEHHKPLIIAVCEVKPKNKDDIKALECNIPRYTMYHVNIENDIGRGVAVFAKSELEQSICELSSPFVEAVILEIRLKGGDCLCFSCFYRRPTKSVNSPENFNRLITMSRDISENKSYSRVCIVGDFNYKAIDWSTWNTLKIATSEE